jgi:hypothetical protein
MSGGGLSVRILCISLFLGALSGATGFAAEPGARLLQPTRDTSGWILRVEKGRVQAEHGGQTTSVGLRRGETLDVVEEAAGGWLAAGGRESESGERRLVLLASDGFATHRLQPPATATGSIGLRPALLVDHGELVGMAWLEGVDPRRLEVRAAVRDGDGWFEPETVAGPAAGSQTALSGTVLADGSWLLVWSAFDGQDDEVQWSVRSGGAWRTPDRLHAGNDVPDITPAVVAEGNGALAAWSRLEAGEYATVVARFSGGRWSQPRAVAGVGSFYPTFHRDAQHTHLVLRNAEPRGWTVLDLAADGSPRRHAIFAHAAMERPAIAADNGSELSLAWPEGAVRQSARWERPR